MNRTWRLAGGAIELHAEAGRHRRRAEFGGGIAVDLAGRWVRLAGFYGEAPGSHMGWWRTSLGGGFHGLNYRAGRWPYPVVTVLAHTHPSWRHP